ncbi:hypothetical protein BYT27DRAFT_7204666, partial [Phlegmacium glaucopus]
MAMKLSNLLKRSLPIASILSPTIKCPSLVAIHQCPFNLAATNNQPTNRACNAINSPPSGQVELL